ncbi:MAG: hypothetical protein QXX95_00130 [Nitrososphaerales archaeon]
MKKVSEDILRLIELCKEVEERALDPFNVNVKLSLDRLKDYLMKCKSLDDLLLDAEALNQLSNLIKLQEEWLKHRASSLYTDPLALKLSIKFLSLEDLSDSIRKSWHPIVSVSNLFREGIERAIDYWNNLTKREYHLEQRRAEGIKLDVKDLINFGFLSEEEFEDKLKNLAQELEKELNAKDKLDYHSFIEAKDPDKKFLRAYLTSFLITRGFASLKYDPMDERYYITKASERKYTKTVVVPLKRILYE